eukprot:XP_011681673.1 PREDICTED: uncharacterized protein LOC105446474 [Strongylocentrotus purpuratus]
MDLATTTPTTEAVTPNVQDNNDSTPSRLIVPIVTTIIIFVLVILAVVGCILHYRRRKNVNSTPNPSEPRSSSQDMYYSTRIQRSVPNQIHENEEKQPDLHQRLNGALNTESNETQNIQTEPSENASAGCTVAGTTSQDEHMYCDMAGLPAGDEGNDPYSHIYSNDIDTTRPHCRPDDISNTATTDNDDYLTPIRSHPDT